MFWAVNKNTKEKLNSIHLLDNPKYRFPQEEKWFADWDEISNANEIKDKFKNGINVIYVNEKECISSLGNKYRCSPHFRIPNASKLGINIIPESPEHKMAKDWIYSCLKYDELVLYYSKVNKPEKYINTIKLSELPINKQRISIETNIIDVKTKRVDVICPLMITHPLFGNGISFEIQFSKQRKSTYEKRTFDAAFGGYSICWIGYDDFNKISNESIEIKKEVLKIDSFAGILNKSNTDHIKKLKFTVQEETRKISGFLNYKKEEIIEETLNEIKEKIKNINNKKIDDLNEKYNEFSEEYNSIKYELSELYNLKEELYGWKGFCPNCKNKIILKEGISKKGNNYKIYECIDPSCGFTKWG